MYTTAACSDYLTGMSQATPPPPDRPADHSALLADFLPAVRPLRFFHRGAIVEVQGLESTTSVLTWLREQARCTGTKEGCNEGDCGACTVLVAELQADDQLQFKPINSCLQFLPTLDGKALITVEDLGGQHPAQQAMVACHGSQCGFCTPGFVMSLAACAERHAAAGRRQGHQVTPTLQAAPTRSQIADDLSGNLCRCTGYRPILDAGEHLFTLPAQALGNAAMAAALRAMREDSALHYAAPTPFHTSFHTPRTLGDLAALRLVKPEARLLAGGTDIGLWVNKQFRELGEIVYLGAVAELKTIRTTQGWLEIGAGASLEAAWTALASHWPAARDMGRRFASLPIREAGTLGGNIANGSPIGDCAPVLIALGARIVLRRGQVQREMALQDFYLAYMVNQLAPGEFVQALRLPLSDPACLTDPAVPAGRQRELLRVYKLSKRHDCDISGLAAGLWLRLAEDGVVSDARFAFGGMAAVVKRAAGAESAVRGQAWTQATVQAAAAALDTDFEPLSDLRASASYRQRAARNLLQRLWLETRLDAPLRPEQTSVWSV
jgi:xanthine dehydrogenase small subunit